MASGAKVQGRGGDAALGAGIPRRPAPRSRPGRVQREQRPRVGRRTLRLGGERRVARLLRERVRTLLVEWRIGVQELRRVAARLHAPVFAARARELRLVDRNGRFIVQRRETAAAASAQAQRDHSLIDAHPLTELFLLIPLVSRVFHISLCLFTCTYF